MDNNNKIAIIGTHNTILEASIEKVLKNSHYDVEKETDSDKFINHCLKMPYDLVIMDLNLEKPGSDDVSIAINTYNTLKNKYTHNFGFIGFSGMDSAIRNATRANVPAIDKMDISEKIHEYIKNN